jgi:hypothetical protein
LFWAVIFLIGIAVLALILPTEYTMGPLLTLLFIVGLIAQIMVSIITLIIYFVALLLSLLFPGIEPPTQPSAPLELMPPLEPAVTSGPPPWLEVMLSAFFWLLILTIVGYALVRFLRERWGWFSTTEGTEGTWRARLLTWLRSLWAWLWNWSQEIQASLAGRRAAQARVQPASWRLSHFFSLRRLPPRELVRYFYLSATKRAEQVGYPRQPGQTPYEYQASLDECFPDLEPDLTGLTDAFVDARYSPQLVKKKDADAVKPLWQRIKRALRRQRTEG